MKKAPVKINHEKEKLKNCNKVTLHVCMFHRFNVTDTDPQKKDVHFSYKPCTPFTVEKEPGCQDVAVSISLSGNLLR